MPAPTLLWREEETVTTNVTSRLSVPTSIHWHGITPPAAMDGVPGVSFAGIAPARRATLSIQDGASAHVPPMDPRPIRTMVDMGMAPAMTGMAMPATPTPPASGMAGMAMGPKMGVGIDNVAMEPIDRLGEPGIGLAGAGRRVLNYRDLRALVASKDRRPPSREIVLHLTGDMDRCMGASTAASRAERLQQAGPGPGRWVWGQRTRCRFAVAI